VLNCSIVIVNKGERAIAGTLTALREVQHPALLEVVVIDASGGGLDDIRDAHQWTRWLAYTAPDDVRVSIPHQRNAGVRAARGEVIVFTDAGCIPGPTWFADLVAPILSGVEQVACGPSHRGSSYQESAVVGNYVEECPTINLAFLRSVYDAAGGFDERFEYGSDIDFTWRLRALGVRLRWVETAQVSHEWGGRRRQAKRSFAYGSARANLYRKHRDRIPRLLWQDPITLIYPLFVLGLPLSIVLPVYPLLLLVPLYRARKDPEPFMVLVDHLLYGSGVLYELSGLARNRRSWSR
jgi:hypothetical protein